MMVLNVAAQLPGELPERRVRSPADSACSLQTLRTAARSLCQPSIVNRSLIKKHSHYRKPPPRFLVPVLFFIFPRRLSSPASPLRPRI